MRLMEVRPNQATWDVIEFRNLYFFVGRYRARFEINQATFCRALKKLSDCLSLQTALQIPHRTSTREFREVTMASLFVLLLLAAVATLVGLVKPSILHVKCLTTRPRVFGAGMVVQFVLVVVVISLLPEGDVERQEGITKEERVIKQDQNPLEEKTAKVDKDSRANQEPERAAGNKTEKAEAKVERGKERSNRNSEDVSEARITEPRAADPDIDKDVTPEERVARWRHRRTKDPNYLTDLRWVLAEARLLLVRSKAATKQGEYVLGRALADSCDRIFRKYDVHYNPKGWLDNNWEKPYSWFHREEEDAWNLVLKCRGAWNLAIFKVGEAEYEGRGALFTREGTFERLVEYAVLKEFGNYHGTVSRFGFANEGSLDDKFVKDIDFENGILTVKLRAESDAYDINYRAREIKPTHPIKTMRNSRDFFAFVFNPRDWPKSVGKTFQKVKQVNIALYFPGEHSSEIVAARYGLTRTAFDAIVKQRGSKWGKLKAKDGTFQDFLKVKGTYYLHREMPDLGTPAHVLRR